MLLEQKIASEVPGIMHHGVFIGRFLCPSTNAYLQRFLPCCLGRGHRAPQTGGVVPKHGWVFVALRGRWALLVRPDLGRQEFESLKSRRQR